MCTHGPIRDDGVRTIHRQVEFLPGYAIHALPVFHQFRVPVRVHVDGRLRRVHSETADLHERVFGQLDRFDQIHRIRHENARIVKLPIQSFDAPALVRFGELREVHGELIGVVVQDGEQPRQGRPTRRSAQSGDRSAPVRLCHSVSPGRERFQFFGKGSKPVRRQGVVVAEKETRATHGRCDELGVVDLAFREASPRIRRHDAQPVVRFRRICRFGLLEGAFANCRKPQHPHRILGRCSAQNEIRGCAVDLPLRVVERHLPIRSVDVQRNRRKRPTC